MCEECERMEELVPDTCRECEKFEDYHDCAACFTITKLLRIREMMENDEDIEPAVLALQAVQLVALEQVKLGMPHAEHQMNIISKAMMMTEPEITSYLGVEPAIYRADKDGELHAVNDKAHEFEDDGKGFTGENSNPMERALKSVMSLGIDNKGLPPLINPNPGKTYLN